MAYSYVRYTGNGSTTNYTFPFPYLSQAHVKVRVNGVITTLFSFLNENTIQFFSAPASGAVIDIRRDTPKDSPVVNFTDGSVLLERDLDLLAQFNLYTAQETSDLADDTLGLDTTNRWDAESKRIGNLAPPVNDDEAVNKGTLVYEYPAVRVVAESVAAVNIVASDLGSLTGLTQDLGSITDPVDISPGPETSKIVTVADNIADVQAVADNLTVIQNAQANANSAAASAASASTSASNASTSAASAANSATSAAASASSATASKNDAQTYAGNAATSATQAASSASAASTSATSAASSSSNAASAATNAAASASTAQTQATAATSSANSAASSATSASNSATSASNFAASASTSATNASNSASSAATSATNAATSETNAAASASSASTSASTASSAATTATTQASNASTSATNAASSASSAATSATNAAASAASAAALLDNFDDRYLGPKASAPTVDNDGNALIVGALYFDTTTNKMRAYTSTGWVDASSAAQAALVKFKFTATAGQTTFSGADVNGLTLAYLAGGEIVALNGVVMVGAGDDYTASNGTSVVLTSAAAAGDTLEVYAFSSFSIASLNGSAIVNESITDAKFAPVLDLGIL